MQIGFIGLGIMGRPMAANLLRGGHALHLHSRSGVPEDLIAAGGKACAASSEVATRSEVVLTMLPDTPDVEQVLFGTAGVAEGLAPGRVVVDMSSISPSRPRFSRSASGRSGASTWTLPSRAGSSAPATAP